MSLLYLSNLGMFGGSVLTRQTFRQALVAKLLSVSDLTAIVGTAIYPGAIPQTHDLRKDGPALTYSLMKFPLTRHIGRVVTGGFEGILSARVQLSAWSYRYADVDAITDVLFAALEGTLNRTDWGNGTVTIVSATKGEEVDLTLPSGIADYRWIHQIASEYEIRYRVPIPVN